MKICVLNDPEWGGFTPDSYLVGYDWEMRDLHKVHRGDGIEGTRSPGI